MQEQMQSARVHYTLLELLYRNREEELERDYPQVLALLSHHSIGYVPSFVIRFDCGDGQRTRLEPPMTPVF